MNQNQNKGQGQQDQKEDKLQQGQRQKDDAMKPGIGKEPQDHNVQGQQQGQPPPRQDKEPSPRR